MKNIFFSCLILLLILIPSNAANAQQNKFMKFINQDNRIRVNEKSGFAKAIYNVNTKTYNGSPKEIAIKYLSDNSGILGVSRSNLELVEIKESPAGRHICFRQMHKGFPVMGSEIVVSINNSNRISMVTSGYKPNIKINTNIIINEPTSLQIAMESIATDESKSENAKRNNLKIYESNDGTFQLVWEIFIIAKSPHESWCVLVDAQSGEIVEKFSSSGNYVNGTGRVFSPDPVSALEDPTLTDNSDSDYAALQGAYVDDITLNNLNDPVGGVYKVQGQYAMSIDKNAPYDTPVAPRSSNFNYNRSQAGFEEVNIYYHVDALRRYIGTLDFSPTWDFEWDASTPAAIRYDARGSISQTAFYSFAYEYMSFGVPSYAVDAGEDQSVIIHEYGHALHDAFISGGITQLTDISDTRGISEGIAEYFAVSYRRQLSDYRPNYRNNWYDPTQGESIKSTTQANYEDHWWPSATSKMYVWTSTLMDMEYETATSTSTTRFGRDITTKLALSSLSYVSVSNDVFDNINAILQADRDIYNGEHLTELAEIFDAREFFIDNKVSGTISANTTWSEQIIVTGDIVVASGVTLTISEDTFVFFESGKNITVNGTLNATNSHFTSADESTYWAGINFASGSSGNLNGCTINNVQTTGGGAIVINNCSPTIEWCTISNNSSSTSGIKILSNGDPYILHNDIYSNYHGIYIYNASGHLQYNHITAATGGCAAVYCYYYANPSFVGTGTLDYGYNVLQNGSYGIFANYYSTPFAGAYTVAKYNSFLSATSYNAYATGNSSIHAEYNYWSPSAPSKIYAASGSSIPWYPQVFTLPGANLNITSKDNVHSLINSSNEDQLLLARELRANGNYVEAISIYKSLIESHGKTSEARIAIAELGNTYKEIKDTSILNYLNEFTALKNDPNNFKPIIYEVLANVHSSYGLREDAKGINEKLIKEYPNTIHEKNAKMNLFFVYYNNQEYNKAKEVLNSIRAEFKDAEEFNTATWLLTLVNETIQPNEFNGHSEYTNNSAELLFDNYPNPFNPTTTIKFQVTEPGLVTIKVYNMVGEEITTLISKNLESGIHRVEFDAGNLPSGVYIYTVNTINFRQSKKMILIK